MANPFDDGESVKVNYRLPEKAGSRYEPVAKFGHQTSIVNDKLFLWAGWQKDFPEVHSSTQKTDLTSTVDVLDMQIGEWKKMDIQGNPPLGVRGYACTTIGSNIYYFGGYCGHGWCRHNTINILDTVPYQWIPVDCVNPNKAPMKKNACGIAAFQSEGEDYLFVFGGAGMLCTANQPEATYIPWKENPDYGWTNEASVFNLKTGEWQTPKIAGDRPPPCAGFTLTKITHNTALLYGGFEPVSGGCLPNSYIVEMDKNMMTWHKLSTSDGQQTPTNRHDHAMVCISGPLFGQMKPMVLMCGGRDLKWETLNDAWLLDCSNGNWRKLEVPEAVLHRHFHSMGTFYVNAKCVYIALFGGVSNWEQGIPAIEQSMISETTLLELVEESGVWQITAVIDHAMLSSSEEYKTRLIRCLFQALRYEASSDQLNESQKTIFRLQEQLKSAESQIASSQKYASEMERLALEAKEQTSEMEQHLNVARRALQDEGDLHSDAKHQHSSPLLKRAIRAEQLVVEAVGRLAQTSIIPNEEIQFTGPVLCKGAFGSTIITTYNGMQLAANVLQDVPETAYNKMILYRELHKIYDVRHPNIVQFIAASVDHGVVILTECVLLSLQQELKKKAISDQEVMCILQDVASALMYLHKRSIIHRAVSPSNILLKELASNWQAKLTDSFCSNYYYFCNGSPQPEPCIYAAPETGANDTVMPNSDVFSFGIVALEMVSQKLPQTTDQEQRLKKLQWSSMANLIKKCIPAKPSERLSSSEVYEQLKRMPEKLQ